jgi:hypothetical protein
VERLLFSPDGRRLFTAQGGVLFIGWQEIAWQVQVWDTATGHKLLGLPVAADVRQLGIGADGRRLLASDQHGFVYLWEAGLDTIEDAQERKSILAADVWQREAEAFVAALEQQKLTPEQITGRIRSHPQLHPRLREACLGLVGN